MKSSSSAIPYNIVSSQCDEPVGMDKNINQRHRENKFRSSDKENETVSDGDSGLEVNCEWDSSMSGLSDSGTALQVGVGVANVNDNFSQSHANQNNVKVLNLCVAHDSGLGQELQDRFDKLSCADTTEDAEDVQQCNRGLNLTQVPRSRPLGNITTALRNAENISKYCSRIINQISPSHRMRLVDEAFAPDKDGDTRLHMAVIHGRLDIIFTLIYLVPHPAYLDLQNNLSQTSMHLAVLTGQPRVVRRLVLAGASSTIRDRHGNTPLHLACERGELECVKELTRAVTSIEIQYLKLMNSAVYQNLPNISIPPNLEIHNYEGRTCVHVATLNQHTEILLWLKQFGANFNAQESKGGRTPLTFAVEARNSNLVEFLVEECEADLDVKNYAGLSAFQIAHRVDEKIATQLELLGAFPSYPHFSDSSDTDLESMDTSDESSDMYSYEINVGTW